MAINNFPAALQSIIQMGYLERAFEQALRAKLAYRAIADKEPFPIRIGETLTKTRAGLFPVVTTPLVPSTNTNFDNGLSTQNWAVEQYTLTINQYAATMDLNTVADDVGIASQFLQNAVALGEQAARSLDALASNSVFGAYLGGNTRVTAAVSASASVPVDDVRGFQFVVNNEGQIVATSSSYPLSVSFGGTTYSVIGVVASGPAAANGGPVPNLLQFSGTGSNTSTTPGGYSGTLTLSAAETIASGAAVVAATAPPVLRPYWLNNFTSGTEVTTPPSTTAGIVAGQTLRMIEQVLAAASTLRLNAVDPIDGLYNCYLDAMQMQGLFSDLNFMNMFRGAYQATEYRQGEIFTLAGVRFIPTNMAPQQMLNGLAIRRALVVGRGALIEGDFKGQDTHDTSNPLAEFTKVDGVTHVTRAAMDRLQQIIAQSWYYIGGFTVPTDITTTAATVPTANNAYYKRAVVLESL